MYTLVLWFVLFPSIPTAAPPVPSVVPAEIVSVEVTLVAYGVPPALAYDIAKLSYDQSHGAGPFAILADVIQLFADLAP